MFPELRISLTPNIIWNACMILLYHIITLVVMYRSYQHHQDILWYPGWMSYDIV